MRTAPLRHGRLHAPRRGLRTRPHPRTYLRHAGTRDLLPYGTDVFTLLAEDYARARTLELISGTRARATFPLRIQHADSIEPIASSTPTQSSRSASPSRSAGAPASNGSCPPSNRRDFSKASSSTTEVYLASELIADLCELLPYGTDVFTLLAEDYARARTLELISGTRARATFPLRIQHAYSIEPIRVTLKKSGGTGLQWELSSVE